MSRYLFLAPAVLLLAACGGDAPPPTCARPTTWLDLASDWGPGIFLVALVLACAIGSRIGGGRS